MDRIKPTIGGAGGFQQFDDDASGTNVASAPSDTSAPSSGAAAAPSTVTGSHGSVKGKPGADGKCSIPMASFNLSNAVSRMK